MQVCYWQTQFIIVVNQNGSKQEQTGIAEESMITKSNPKSKDQDQSHGHRIRLSSKSSQCFAIANDKQSRICAKVKCRDNKTQVTIISVLVIGT